MSDTPERIWLQWVEPYHNENTFCEDQINEDDIEYIRADFYKELGAEVEGNKTNDRMSIN